MTDDQRTQDRAGLGMGGQTGDELSADDEIEVEVEAQVAEIEATRDEMTATVEAIGDKLDPSNIVEGAKETVRDATVGKVETMAENAGAMFNEAGSTVQDAGSGILETIRENPIPAAMAGIGLGWLLTHRSSGNVQSRRYRGGEAWGYGDRWSQGDQGWRGETRQARQMSGSTGQGGGGVQEKIGDVAGTVQERVGDVGSTVGQVPQRIGGSAQSLGEQAQRLLEESPLAVGAAAVAVGAAIGLALPASRMEREMLGPTSEKLISTAEQTATQAMQQARGEGSQEGMPQGQGAGSTGSAGGA